MLKSFIKTSLLIFIVTYFMTFIAAGIIWDPNGVNLFTRPFFDSVKIVLLGLALSVPLGVYELLPSEHPIFVVVSLGFFGCAVVGWLGRSELAGRRVLYVPL